MNRGFAWMIVPLFVVVLLYSCVTAAQKPREGSVPAIKRDCSTCHVDIATGPALNKPLSSLCIECHPDRTGPGEHRVGMTLARPVDGLPVRDGMMSCITCHDPHSNSNAKMLRLPAKAICGRCHPY